MADSGPRRYPHLNHAGARLTPWKSVQKHVTNTKPIVLAHVMKEAGDNPKATQGVSMRPRE